MSTRTRGSQEDQDIEGWARTIAAWIEDDKDSRFAQFYDDFQNPEKLQNMMREVERDRVLSGSASEPLGADAPRSLCKKGNGTEKVRDMLYFAVSSSIVFAAKPTRQQRADAPSQPTPVAQQTLAPATEPAS